MDPQYLHRPWTLLRHPMLGSGLVLMKGGEMVVVPAAMARQATSGAPHTTDDGSVCAPTSSDTPDAT